MSLPQLNVIDIKDNLAAALDVNSTHYDGLVVLFADKTKLAQVVPSVKTYLELDQSFGKSMQVICPADQKPFPRILIAPLGTISSDVDDARRFKGKQTWTGHQQGQACVLMNLTFL
jgi:hypothetical protein